MSASVHPTKRNSALVSATRWLGSSLARLSGNQDLSAQPYGGTQSNLVAYMLYNSVSTSAYAATRPQNKARALASKVDPHAYSLLALSPAAATALRIPIIRNFTASTDRLCDRSLQSIAAQSAAHDGKCMLTGRPLSPTETAGTANMAKFGSGFSYPSK